MVGSATAPANHRARPVLGRVYQLRGHGAQDKRLAHLGKGRTPGQLGCEYGLSLLIRQVFFLTVTTCT